MKVTLYKTMTCPYCHMETEWLKEKKVPFGEIYVDKDPAAAEEMIHKSGQMGVPVTEVTKDDGSTELVLGFDQPKLSQLLHISS
jgi:glutaredoxin 3